MSRECIKCAKIQMEIIYLKQRISHLQYQLQSLNPSQRHSKSVTHLPLKMKTNRVPKNKIIVPKQTIIYKHRNKNIIWLKRWLKQ